jgi:hypothetical protein
MYRYHGVELCAACEGEVSVRIHIIRIIGGWLRDLGGAFPPAFVNSIDAWIRAVCVALRGQHSIADDWFIYY